MKIKIGNFNYINDMENEFRHFGELDQKFNYFWLDGKEDTLFVTNMTNFEMEQTGRDMPEYEKNLKSQYKIIYIYGQLKNQVNQYINNKVEQFFNNRNYSKYELYKNMDFLILEELNDNKFKGGGDFILDIEKNKINVGSFQFNPYTEKVDNLEENFKKGVLNQYIKKGLILKEIEKGIAPPYIYELQKIINFLQDKENVNLIFKDCEKFKSIANITDFFYFWDKKLEIKFEHDALKNFKNKNPLKKIDDLKLEDFKGISYGKNLLEVDGISLINIDKQSVISLDDRLKQKVDLLKEDIKEEYSNLYRKMHSKGISMPPILELAINDIEENKDSKRKFSWNTQELKDIIHKNSLINSLQQAKTSKDIKDICIELDDNELLNIYYGMLYEKEDLEENNAEEM